MHLVAIAWIYVVAMMSIVEATSSGGTLIGALVTFVLYGVLPLGIVIYLMRTPVRRRARLAAEQAESASLARDPDRGGHAPGASVAPEREES
jgi:predicted membrane channel-forming protein YqfA (hemolysin III family)